jgi:hypothetical protein
MLAEASLISHNLVKRRLGLVSVMTRADTVANAPCTTWAWQPLDVRR